MYGSTESQRAVSFHSIPPPVLHAYASAQEREAAFTASAMDQAHAQSDLIPAGRGMQNVQLLVCTRRPLNQSQQHDEQDEDSDEQSYEDRPPLTAPRQRVQDENTADIPVVTTCVVQAKRDEDAQHQIVPHQDHRK